MMKQKCSNCGHIMYVDIKKCPCCGNVFFKEGYINLEGK
jgi:RNA polymerase subunit RPABC4/transcription elongation factor Spt4